VIALLSRPQGTTIAAIMKETGTACGARLLRRNGAQEAGLTLVSEKVGGERVYRVVGPAPQATKSSRRAA
jgi:hypothetical protein